MEKASFAAGCFWGVEEAFAKIPGVEKTTVGYTGGHLQNPSYEQVCSDTSGHAEAVLVEYNPEVISFDQLLEAFWGLHDPTQLNRQGPDSGSQYRSAIFYTSEDQHKTALNSMQKLEQSGKYSHPIVTKIVPATEFYRAEDYHQKYFEKKQCSF